MRALHEASDHSDRRTPVVFKIQIEEEDNLLNSSSEPFLTIGAMVSETISLAIDAVNALDACSLCQGEPPIAMCLFMQWLNNSETIRKYLSG